MVIPLEVKRDSHVIGPQFSDDKETVEIVTQLSIDRIQRLEILCHVWNGPIVAVILDEDRTATHGTEQTTQQILEKLEIEVTTRVGFHSLRTILVSRENSSAVGAAGELPYPINGLRNIALKNATSEYVFLLDVDCIPSCDLFDSLIGTFEMKNSLRNICIQYLGAIVVPCFEPSEDASFNPQHLFTSHDIRSLANLPSPQFCQFAMKEFDRGHGATNFPTWLCWSDQSNRFQQYYQVGYQEGYEPFVIVARILAPLYCEELVGYGRNKILHIYQMFRLGMSFWVTTSGCIVHTPHSLSVDRIKLLGSDESSEELDHGRLEEVKSIYQRFRNMVSVYCTSWSMEGSLLNTAFLNFSNLASPIEERRNHSYGSSIASWPTNKYLNNLLRSVFPSPPEGDSCFQCVDLQVDQRSHGYSEEFLANLCSIHMVYKCPALSRLRCYGFDNLKWNTIKINNIESSVWLVTHLSFDRMNRLISLCSGWEGPVAAVIWIPPKISSSKKRKIIRELDDTISSTFMNSQCSCQIKCVILENSSSLASTFRQRGQGTILSPSLYPFNALRGAALDIVEECEKSIKLDHFLPENHLVLMVDVDMRPPALLYQSLSKSYIRRDDSSLTSALQCCIDGDFLILPALELDSQIESKDTVEEFLVPNPSNIEYLLSTSDVRELRACLKSISRNIQPFHIKQYPEGHGASQTSFWLEYIFSDQLESLTPIFYQEGYEPYGILSLKTILDCGGFHRSFVGRHRDKVEFIMRLHMLGINFKLWLHPAAFVFDWLPHPPDYSEENKIHRIVMEGLYRRSRRQLYRFKEIPWSSSTSSSLPDSVNPSVMYPSLPFDKLPEIFRSSTNVGDEFWKSDEIIKVHSAQPIPSIQSNVITRGMFNISQCQASRTVNGVGISIPFSVNLPLKTLTSLGISCLVQFPSSMRWHGGSLVGLRATTREISSVLKLPFAKTGEIDGRIKWNENGSARFQLTGISMKTPGFHIVISRETQFHKGVWHLIQIVFSLDGHMEASVDGVLIFSAKYLPKFLSLDGIRMSVMTYMSDQDSITSDPINLQDIMICGSSENIEPRAVETSHDTINHLISKELSVIFAPKEWHSLASRSLADFLSSYHYVFHLIIVIAPPIAETLIDEMKSIVSSYPHCNVTFHEAECFQNPYEIRNIISRSIQSKYTLHLNNDIFSVHGHSCWLEKLIKCAEQNPRYCAIMPFLLENNLQEANRLHVWWKDCKVYSDEKTQLNHLHAMFDNQILRYPFEDIRKKWKKNGVPPLLFLEDHCILACSAFFLYQPLFDQYSCYRREFFDLAWTIRSRGGEVGMAIDSVVVYQRVQPLSFVDLPYFLQRRQDYLCYSSQVYLNQKWKISYRYDRWHEKQRYESILGMQIDLNKIFSSLCENDRIARTAELLLCFFVAVGANRFKCVRNGPENLDEISDGERMNVFYPKISSLDWSSTTSALHFRQELAPLDYEPSITPHLQDRFLGMPPETERNPIIVEPEFVSNPFSGYCLFRLCYPSGCSNKSSSINIWKEIISKQVNVESCAALDELPSLILQYLHPNQPDHSSVEVWVWVKTDLEIPNSIISMPSEGKSRDYDLIHSTVISIANYLGLTLIPATHSSGTHLWQSCDLIREEMSSSGPIQTTAQLLSLSFRPQTLAEIREILSFLQTINR